jgi:hypothetical protein
MDLSGVLQLVAAFRGAGLTLEQIGKGLNWVFDQFGTDYTDAQRKSLVDTGVRYAAELARVDDEIARRVAAQTAGETDPHA